MEDQLSQIGVVAIALGLGALVGLEREFADKPAGLRTHMFVCAAAAMLMLLGNAVLENFHQDARSSLRTDPLRIIEAIIVGISFLGAGTIIHRGDNQVEGLTTASSVLLTACIGIAVAVGQLVFAIGITGVAVLVLLVVGRAEKRIAQFIERTSSKGDNE